MSTLSPWKQDFPIFLSHAHPHLSYFDSAATCLTPKHVADAMFHYQCFSHANSHKGLYQLSATVTEKVEHARERIAQFIGASNGNNITFNHGTTDALNLVAYSYVEPLLIEAKQQGKQSNIIVSAAEHHANLLPWQRLAEQYQAELRIAPLDENGLIDIAALSNMLDRDTRVVAVTHCSNVLGNIQPVEQICRIARNKNVATVIDGAQAISHGGINVNAIGCDFYAFSAHKLYGPTGCGVLFVKDGLIEQMRPYQLGGGVINTVSYQESDYISGPLKLEPGSHNVASIVGLVEAIDYLEDLSWSDINNYMENLASYLHKSLNELPFYRSLALNEATLINKTLPTLVSFQLDKVHSHDIASLLDSENIAVRAGHHCAQPLHKTLGVNSSVRVSLGLYNEFSDIDKLITSLATAHQMMAID